MTTQTTRNSYRKTPTERVILENFIPSIAETENLEILNVQSEEMIQKEIQFLKRLDKTLRTNLNLEDYLLVDITRATEEMLPKHLIYTLIYTEKYFNLKLRQKALRFVGLNREEKDTFIADLCYYLVKNYDRETSNKYIDERQSEIEDILDSHRDNNEIIDTLLEKKKINSKELVSNMLKNVTKDDAINAEFRKEMRKYIAKKVTADLGKPTGTKSYVNKNLLQSNVIIKEFISKRVNQYERHGFKVYEKRELNSLARNTQILTDVSSKIESDELDVIVEFLNQLVEEAIIVKCVKLTEAEKKLVNSIIVKNYDELANEYGFGLEFKEDFNTIFNKELKKSGFDLRNLKTKDNYLDIELFETNVTIPIRDVLKILFERQNKINTTKQNNYKNIMESVFKIVNEVCEYSSKDEVNYQVIKNVVSRIENNRHVDNVTYVDETMTALITYSDDHNQNQGMFLINPYTLIEVYNQRVYVDLTKQIELTDKPLRANALTGSLAKYLVENLKPIYKKRNDLNILNAELSETDLQRIGRLEYLLIGDKMKTDVLVPNKIKFAVKKDSQGNISHIVFRVKSRNFIVSPAIIYDVEEKQVLFKRENPNATLTELENSNFNKAIPNADNRATNIILNLLLLAFDLRKGKTTLDSIR